MSHKSKKTLVEQVLESLDKKFTPGQSRHADKLLGATEGKIYSYETLRSYKKHACYFANWCRHNETIKAQIGHYPRTLEECRAFIPAWLQERIGEGKSAYTVRLEAASLAKLYGCSIDDFDVKLPGRNRADITRSRGEAVRDDHFSEERNKELVVFCKATGLRRHELEALRGTDLRERDGSFFLHVRGKGGRERLAPVFGSDEAVKAVVQRMRDSGRGRVWLKVHDAADVHSYRAAYATAIYKHYERDIDTLDRSERYDCRTDRSGTHFDREAMRIASEALGHSRINVIASHYLRDI